MIGAISATALDAEMELWNEFQCVKKRHFRTASASKPKAHVNML